MDPSVESANVWYHPVETWMIFVLFNTPVMITETGDALSEVVLSPSWPLLFHPHEKSDPFPERAIVCHPPPTTLQVTKAVIEGEKKQNKKKETKEY